MSEVLEEEIICVSWDSLSLKKMPDSMIADCEEEGLEWRKMNLLATDVELATPRDSEKEVAQATSQIEMQHAWDHLGEESREIQKILSGADPNNEWAVLGAWMAHLEKVLKFPFAAEVTEWQERGGIRSGDRVTVQGITDVDDLYGVLANIRHERMRYDFPLCDLAAIDKKSSNYKPVQLYAVWFANR